MKIGDKCWVVVQSNGQIVGAPKLFASQKQIESECLLLDSEQPLRVRIVPADDGWQTMESAPKDGTKILLRFVEPDGEETIAQAFWEGEIFGWTVASLPCHGCGCCADDNPIPTHWRHLPPPPETE